MPSAVAPDRASALELATRLESWGRERRWQGSDPYDGLSARRRFVAPLRRRARGRQVLTQAVKRSPVDMRPLLGIPPGTSAAALAWVVSAYSRAEHLDLEGRPRLRAALRQLDELRCPDYDRPCWGYHFDVQSRVFFYSRRTPNTIASAFAGHALLDAHRTLGEAELLSEARGVGEFFLEQVPQTEDPPGAYFGYLPGDSSPIHNSSLLVASLLARLAAAGGGERFAAPAAAAIRYATARQRSDGAWPYGERRNLDWVDGFHTGYVLDALLTCAEAGIGGAEAEESFTRGLAFYRRRLFDADGAPRYHADELYPIDAQCVSQGIQTLAIASRLDPGAGEQAWRVFGFARERMLGPDGMPLFQRRRRWTNRTLHPRWVVAPTLLALVHLLGAGTPAPSPPTVEVA
jgi:hypothetical protein